MKVLITGPRSGLTEDFDLPWMHIEVDLEALPVPGEVIILNSGSGYYVKDRMWWIDGPENDAYWSRKQDYEVEGRYQTCHLFVEPDNRRENHGYPAGLEDGMKRGGEEWLAELRKLVDLSKDAGIGDGLKLIDTWLARQEKVVAGRLEAERQQSEAADRILAEIRREKDGLP